MTAYRHKCPNCLVEFIAVGLLYCPYCGSPLQQQGLAQYTPREYAAAGWDIIALRSTKSGFIVKDMQDRNKL